MGKLLNTKFEMPVGYIEEYVSVGQFTDGGSTSGTYQMQETIPAGAHVLATLVTNVIGFAGDTTATLVVGDGSDVDRYNTGTPSVVSNVAMVAMGAVSGTVVHTAAVRPTLTITGGSDFGKITAGALAIRIVYLKGL